MDKADDSCAVGDIFALCVCHEILNRAINKTKSAGQGGCYFLQDLHHYACNLLLSSVGVGGSPCLVVIVDLLGSAHIVVVVVEKLCVFF